MHCMRDHWLHPYCIFSQGVFDLTCITFWCNFWCLFAHHHSSWRLLLIHVVFFRSSVGIQVHCVSDLLFFLGFRFSVFLIFFLWFRFLVQVGRKMEQSAFSKEWNSQSVTFICDYERAGFSAALSIWVSTILLEIISLAFFPCLYTESIRLAFVS